tara:strand:- start:5196 stop:5675 length:480 start_codon:yes stop_codon:yes gene_type:complete
MTISAGGKGDKQRPTIVSQAHRDAEHERLFGNTVKAGRFKASPDTGEMIPLNEWYDKYYVPTPKTHFVQGDIEPFHSPIDMKVINSRPEYLEDLKRSGSRHWEGQEQEQRYADQHNADTNAAFEASLDDKMLKVQNEIKNKSIETAPADKPLSWTFGED